MHLNTALNVRTNTLFDWNGLKSVKLKLPSFFFFRYLWEYFLLVWSVSKHEHTSIANALAYAAVSHQQQRLLFHWLIHTSTVSPSSSFSLILFTCCRRRSQYNLSSDILVFSASVFSWSSVIVTAHGSTFGKTFTVFYNRTSCYPIFGFYGIHIPFSLFVRLSVRQALAVPSATSHFCLSAALMALR